MAPKIVRDEGHRQDAEDRQDDAVRVLNDALLLIGEQHAAVRYGFYLDGPRRRTDVVLVEMTPGAAERLAERLGQQQ